MIGLRECKLFANLPPGDLQALERIAQKRHYHPGQIIFQEGDAGDGLFLILEGEVQIRAKVSGDEQRSLSELNAGDFFGEMALMDREPRSATALSETEVTVAFLPRQELVPWLESSASLVLSLNRQFSLRMREFNRRYLEEVLQAERLALVGRFARSIVHDFKNPLAIIGVAAELVGSGAATPEIRRIAQHRIQSQVERLSNMINELLEFSRGDESGKVLAPVDYGTFLNPLLEDIRQEAALKSVVLDVPQPPPRVRLLMDPRRLTHVFYNLIHNAVDAMPQGGRVQIRFRLEPREVITEIHDAGPGIDPAIADRLFQPFATHGKTNGTGLGLSICRRIIEDHSGTIQARNAPEGGAVFWFSLPIPT
jgi:signal transduction histidine kinase